MTNPEVSVVPTQAECDELIAGIRWTADPSNMRSGMTLEADEVTTLAYMLAHQTPPATQPITTVGEVPDGAAIAAAIKATEYKYFGDYEMSDDQREAVDVLVRVAQHYASATLHTPPPVATATDEAVVEKCAKAMWLCDEHWYSGDTWEAVPDYGQNLWRDRARACLDTAAGNAVTTATVVDAGWIVGNGAGDKWRQFDSLGFWGWTDQREDAMRYARREDAERMHAEDDDVWRVEPFAATPTPPAGGQ